MTSSLSLNAFADHAFWDNKYSWQLESFYVKLEVEKLSMGCGQVVRLRVLVPPFGGSNPSTPEKETEKEKRTDSFLKNETFIL